MAGTDKGSKIIAFFEKIPGVAAVYLFGSASKERKNPEDIDIAVLFDDNAIPDFRTQLRWREDLTALLKKEVDWVVLNKANPILRHQVLRGNLLVNNDPDRVNCFFSRTVSEYSDLKKIRAPIEKNLLKGRRYGS